MSIFDAFRKQPDEAADDSPLSVDDLMVGGGEENPTVASGAELPPPTGEVELHNVADMGPETLSEEGPEFSTVDAERAELRDFLLERAKAREDRSLEYQKQARAANGLPE